MREHWLFFVIVAVAVVVIQFLRYWWFCHSVNKTTSALLKALPQIQKELNDENSVTLSNSNPGPAAAHRSNAAK